MPSYLEYHLYDNPFPHIIWDDVFEENMASEISAAFPGLHENIWHEYNNPIEKKLTCNNWAKFPDPIYRALSVFMMPTFTKVMADMFGETMDLDRPQADPGLHGGGMHCTKNGGKLDIHIDYAIHPKLKLERRLNLIYYCSKDWKPEYGGCLEFWNKDMSACVKSVEPIFNRAVIFETGDTSYHGHPDPLTCPETWTRNSLAVYYLTHVRPETSERYRARFVGRPTDPKDAELEAFREKRSKL